MKVIKELIRLLDKSKIQPIKVLDFSNSRQNKYKLYYEAILENEYLSEDNLAQKFSEDTVSSKKYLMFKNRFRKRLINYILFLDYSNRDVAIKAISKAYRLSMISKLLMLVGAKSSSYYYANKSIKYATEYELFDLLILLNQIYITKYSFENSMLKLEKEVDKMNKNIDLYTIDLKVDALYAKSGVLLSKTEVLSKINFDSYKKIIDELKDIINNKTISFKSNWLVKSCEIEYYEYIGNYEQVLVRCNELQESLIQNPQFNFNVRKLFISSAKLEAFGALNNITESYEILDIIEDLVKHNTYNWFHAQRKIFEFYVNTKQYKNAFIISSTVISNENFINYNSRLKEIWILRHAYASIICSVLKIGNNYDLKDIKVEKVLNSIISMSKDKLGVNLAAIILEILFKFFNNEIDELIDRYNILMHYKLRHLKPAKLKRATIFFDFIIRVSQKGFMKNILKQESQKALQKLSLTKNKNAERKSFEIIPYEEIISIMMEY